MISINYIDIVPKRFPDGTFCLLDIPTDEINSIMDDLEALNFNWKYESEDECILLWYLVNHFKAQAPKDILFRLTLCYVCNARMDRCKNPSEVFTLKYFAKFINSMEFDEVELFDPHSDVSPALFNNCSVISPKSYIIKAMRCIPKGECEVIPYYPDAGCVRRLNGMFPGLYLYGEKNRDWKTGEILGLELKGSVDEVRSIKNKVILIIDDICSHGGTFYYSAKELKKAFPDTNIYSYATHTENYFPTLQKAFDEKLIEKHFTTNSLYKGENNKIYVFKC